MDFCSHCTAFGQLLIKVVPKKPNFFLFRAALKDHPSGHFTTDDADRPFLSPLMEIPQNAGVTYHLRPYVGPAPPPLCGPPRKGGMRVPPLILSSMMGAPENTGVT